jgi:hypothetical protein
MLETHFFVTGRAARGRCYDHNFLQFLAKKIGVFFSKTNVRIKFLQKVAAVSAKNANIFAKKLGENIFKIITSVPDGANFRLLGV